MPHRAVYKTRTAEFLDEFYSGRRRAREEAYEDAGAFLRGDESLLDVTRELERRDDGFPGRVGEFDEFWLRDSGKRGGKSVERVLRFGYQHAVELASARGLPIENFWITGAGDDFELHICESSDRISVFMVVPAEEDRDYGSHHAQSRSWVVRAGDLDDVDTGAAREVLDDSDPPIYKIQVSGPKNSAYGA